MRANLGFALVTLIYLGSTTGLLAYDLPASVGKIFGVHCQRCHTSKSNDEKAKGKIPDIFDLADLERRGKLIAGDPEASSIYTKVRADLMPENAGFGTDPVPEEDKEVLRRWIASLKSGSGLAAAIQATPSPADRRFLDDTRIVTMILADIAKQNPLVAKKYRYLTLSNLHNNTNITDSELEIYREAVIKAVNSLTTLASSPYRPETVDPERTIFKLDIAFLGWTTQLWENVAEQNPYARYADNIGYRALASFFETSQPVIRADWFVTKATQPPLYHDFVRVPETVDLLEKSLFDGRSALSNVRDNKNAVFRVGIREGNSGVSTQNRMLERHSVRGTYYWKSFDFGKVDPSKQDVDRRSFFNFPVGPGTGDQKDESGFIPDGGEIIFGLPNGFQAYMLLDGVGRRIFAGPQEVVQNREASRRRNTAVVNGISCMSCHTGGMRPASDELNAHVQQSFFTESVKQQVAALHRTAAEIDGHIRRDGARFENALEEAGIRRVRRAQDGTPPNPKQFVSEEQITKLVDHFELDLVRIEDAAGEFGMPLAQLRQKLATVPTNPNISPTISTWNNGGGVPRNQHLRDFKEIAKGLGLIVEPPDVSPPELRRLVGKLEEAGTERSLLQASLTDEAARARVVRGELLQAKSALDLKSREIGELIDVKGALELRLNELLKRVANSESSRISQDADRGRVEAERSRLQSENATYSARLRDLNAKLSSAVSAYEESNRRYAALEEDKQKLESRLSRMSQSTTPNSAPNTINWVFYAEGTEASKWSERYFNVMSRPGETVARNAFPKPDDTIQVVKLGVAIRDSLPRYESDKAVRGGKVGEMSQGESVKVRYTAVTPRGALWIGIDPQ